MMQRILPTLSAVAAAAALVAPARGERWSAWKGDPESPLVARFVPSVDLRERKFDETHLAGYADLAPNTLFPGEIVFTLPPSAPDLSPGDPEEAAAPSPLSFRPGDTLAFVVEAVCVDAKHSGAPAAPRAGAFASNPFLPFGLPSGAAGKPAASVVRMEKAPGPGGEVRVPVVLASRFSWSRRSLEEKIRVRWSVLAADAGRVVARGVLPEAFFNESFGYNFSGKLTVDATAEGTARIAGAKGFATPATWNAWPSLETDAGAILFDAAGFDAAFPADRPEKAVRFASHARLLGIRLVGKDPEGAAKLHAAGVREEPSPLLVPSTGEGAHAQEKLANVLPAGSGGIEYDGTGGRADAERAENERCLKPARVPGASLGRRHGPFVAATAGFLAVFAIGAVAVLVRHFAFRRGEARLAVWRALPLWSAACAAFALLVLPLALDRRPYADVTEWRYGLEGSDEALCFAEGRAQTFEAGSTPWSVPADAWFDCEFDRGVVFSLAGAAAAGDGPAPRSFATPAPRVRGQEEKIRAVRFAEHRSPVSLSPDPDFDFDAFAREASFAPGAEGSDSAARGKLKALVADWLVPVSLPPSVERHSVPNRMVSATEDLDGVFVFARGRWYALGPMKAGERRPLRSGHLVWRPLETDGKTYGNLFSTTLFALKTDDIRSFANLWLARENGAAGREKDADGEGVGVPSGGENAIDADEIERVERKCSEDDGGESFGAAAADRAMRDYDEEDLRGLVRKLGSAFVVAVKNAGADAAPFLAPEFRGGPKAGRTTGRIVHLEVFP